MYHSIRNEYSVRVWTVSYEINKFLVPILVEGTEPEMQEYMESEMGYVGRYHALTNEEVRQAKMLGLKVYIAPKL